MMYAVILLAVASLATQLQVMALRKRVEDLERPGNLRREIQSRISKPPLPGDGGAET